MNIRLIRIACQQHVESRARFIHPPGSHIEPHSSRYCDLLALVGRNLVWQKWHPQHCQPECFDDLIGFITYAHELTQNVEGYLELLEADVKQRRVVANYGLNLFVVASSQRTPA